jgi:hypothetical protein
MQAASTGEKSGEGNRKPKGFIGCRLPGQHGREYDAGDAIVVLRTVPGAYSIS